MMSNIVLDLIGKKSCNRSFPPTTSSSSERQRNLLLRMHLLRVNTKKTSVLSKILWRRRRAEPFSLPRRPTSHKWRMRWLQRYPLTPRTLTGIHSSSSPRSKDRRYRSHCGIFFSYIQYMSFIGLQCLYLLANVQVFAAKRCEY